MYSYADAIAMQSAVDISGGTFPNNVSCNQLYLSGAPALTDVESSSAVSFQNQAGTASYSGSGFRLRSYVGNGKAAVSNVADTGIAEKITVYNGSETGLLAGRLIASGTDLLLETPKASGTAGDVQWLLYSSNGDLFLMGSGAIPDYATYNGNYAPWYNYRSDIRHLYVSEGVTGIGAYAFNYSYTKLESVSFGSASLTLGNYCFFGCTALTEIDFGSGTIQPGTYVFGDCDALTSVHIPENVVMNGSYADPGSGYTLFYSCDSLQSAVVDCAYVGPFTFEGCYAMTDVTFTDPNVQFYFLDNDSGHPLHPNGSNSMNVTVHGHLCSKANVLVQKSEGRYNVNLTFAQIEGDTTQHTEQIIPGTASCTADGLSDGKVCAVCGYVLQEQTNVSASGHTEVIDEAKAATCTEAGLTEGKHCSVCNEIIIAQKEIPAKGHDYQNVVTDPTCTEQGYTTHTCSSCGDTYADSYTDPLGHTLELRNAKDAACTEAGYTGDQVCTVCGKTVETGKTIPPLGHDLVHHDAKDPTCSEIGWEAYDTCSRCDYTTYKEIPAAGHSYQDVVTAPTCTEQGYTTHTCSSCGDTYVDSYTNALGHTLELRNAKDAACTEAGYTGDQVCTVCGKTVETGKTIPPLGHDLVHHDAKDPTCTEIGWEAYDTCSRCDYTTYKEIPAAGHSYQDVVTAPTCTEQGYTTHTCSSCGDTYADSYTDPLGHTLELRNAKDAACTEAGYTGDQVCSVCGKTVETGKTIPPLGHDLVHHDAKDPTCTEIGWEAYDTCSRCDYTTYKEIPAAGHSYQDVVTVPTCTEQGYTTHTCSSCGDTYADSYTNALGHTLELRNAKDAACTEAGYTGDQVCTACGKTVETGKMIPPLGHDLVHHDAKDPTCTEIGWEAYDTCSRCDYTTYKEAPAFGHTVVTDEAVAATCTETGLTEGKHCSVCEEVLVAQKVVPATGHTEVVDNAVAATCTETGLTEGSHCSVCNEVLVAQEVVPATGHSYKDTVTAPTCGEKGYTTHTCTICGDSYVDSYVDATGEHVYTDDLDTTCDVCGYVRELPAPETVPVYRLYNPYTQEHLLTGEEEKDILVSAGWSLDGLAWKAPTTGYPVYRLYNPYGDFHFYSTSEEEIATLTPLGWTVDGVVSYSADAETGSPVYRLFNPYAETNYHLFTASQEERDWLASLGWKIEGVAWYCAKD